MKKRLLIVGMTVLLALTAFAGAASASQHPDPMVAPNTSMK